MLLYIGAVAALLSAFAAASSSLIAKEVVPRLGHKLSLILIVGISTVTIALMALLFNAGTLAIPDLVLSAASGIFLALGFMLFFIPLSTENITNAVGIVQVQPVFIILFGILVLNEVVNDIQLVAMLVILVGSVLVATTRRLKFNRRIISIFPAGLCWSIYWIFIAYSVNDSGNFLLPLLTSRIVWIAVLLLYLLAFGKGISQKAKKVVRGGGNRFLIALLLLGMLGGLANGFGDTLFAAAAYYKVLAIGSAIRTITPALVAIAAYLIYKERMNTIESVGFAAILIGVAALNIA